MKPSYEELEVMLQDALDKIKASQDQEPHHWLLKPSASNTHVSLSRRELSLNGNFNEHWQIEAGYYAQPPIPPELAELQRENAELRKLLESKVPEGWQLVPKKETEAMHDAVMAVLYKGVTRMNTQKLLDAYLAAATQPKEPKQ